MTLLKQLKIQIGMKTSLTIMDFLIIAAIMLLVAVGLHFLFTFKDANGNKLKPAFALGSEEKSVRIVETDSE